LAQALELAPFLFPAAFFQGHLSASMRKDRNVRRTPASEDIPVRKVDRQCGLAARRNGDLGEVAFLHKATELGLMVAQPYGTMHAFDFLVLGRAEHLPGAGKSRRPPETGHPKNPSAASAFRATLCRHTPPPAAAVPAALPRTESECPARLESAAKPRSAPGPRAS
jgi:hypothetical protein